MKAASLLQFSTRALVDCGEFFSGGTPNRAVSEYWGGPIPWISAKSLKRFQVGESEESLTDVGAQSGSRVVPRGTILFVVRGMSLAKEFRVGIATRSVAFNQDLRALIPHADVDPLYLTHFLRSEERKILTLVDHASHGTTRLTSERVDAIKVPVPPLDEQRRIAEVLDRAEALRAKRRAALALLDTLTQSIFLDLFGDPATNQKELERTPIGELLRLKSGDFLPADAMHAAGTFSVYGGNGINGYHDKFLFEEPRIVIGRVGAYCGCVHLSRPRSWITDNALYVSELSPRLDVTYLVHALAHAQLNQYASQSGQPLVSGSRLYPIQILVPPMALQQDFARRIAAVEKLKSAQRASLAELDALFASLQHRAFRGEL